MSARRMSTGVSLLAAMIPALLAANSAGCAGWHDGDDADPQCDLAARGGTGRISRTDGHPARFNRNHFTRTQPGSHRRNRHNYNTEHEQRHDMLDGGNLTINNVRIHHELRWRRNGNWNRNGAPATAATASAAMSGSTAMSGSSTSSGISNSSGLLSTSGVSATSGTLDTAGLSGMCGSGSSSVASSSTPTSTAPTAPGGAARTGIPLGSFEIGNLGVSATPAVPTTTVSPIVGFVGPTPLAPTVPTIAPPPVATSTAPTAPSGAPGSPDDDHARRLLKQRFQLREERAMKKKMLFLPRC